ncbi:MAG: AbrB/MazE/SpoVT family DNA-binding domain-containing protein [Alkalinema sp. RL_2_19]|nr:AbrB/MazE/SpoVT family DNA-binding domain-containing protein [Alkalinema sp. RL_2_19]
MEITIRKVGNSMGVTFPKELLSKLHVSEGDKLFVTESPDGFLISAYDPAFAEAMEAYQRLNKRYRNASRELAK